MSDLRQLEAPRIAADQVHNTAKEMLITLFVEPSWRAMAVRQLDFFRVLRGEITGVNPFAEGMPAVPATWNADVLALADYWTDQLARIGNRASDAYHQLVYLCWRQVLHRVMQDAIHASALDTCTHNVEFWNVLVLLTMHSDASDEKPTPWTCRVPCGRDHRNAQAVDTGPTLDFPAAKTWDEAAQMQRDTFSKLRSEDLVTGRLIHRVPRTTIADVRQLAAYWASSLAKVGEHSSADISYKRVLRRWKDAVAEVDRIPPNADPASVYEHNTDFWEAVLTIAIQIAVTAEAPTRWTLVKEATKQAIAELPNTLKTTMQYVAGSALVKPILYAGAGLGGLALLLYFLRHSGNHESHA